MIPKFRAWNSETKEIEVFETYEEISELFLALSADDGFYSIMQSTGLKDKNGKEIFEGDVVRQVRTQPTTENETITGVVTMLEGAWSIVNDNKQLASFLWSETAENEIIGNIWEDGDLIDSKKTSEN